MLRLIQSKILAMVPYGLHFYNVDFKHINRATNLNYLGRIDNSIHKPILHPCDDLFKEISIEGKTCIPIVELAKFVQPGWIFRLNELYNDTCISEERIGNIYYEFDFDSEEKVGTLIKRGVRTAQTTEICLDILRPKFNELLLDCDNLIQQGIAIDINSLKNNPYK